MKTLKSTLISLAVYVGVAAAPCTSFAQTYQPLGVSSNTIPALSTNNVAGTAIANGYISKQDIYYDFYNGSTNGQVILPIQSSPDGNVWSQVQPAYLATGTTNEIRVTLPTVGGGIQTNHYSGVVTVDTSHGQQFRVGSEINTGTSSGGGNGGTTGVSLNYYSQH